MSARDRKGTRLLDWDLLDLLVWDLLGLLVWELLGLLVGLEKELVAIADINIWNSSIGGTY